MDILTLNEGLNRIVYGFPMKPVFLLVGLIWLSSR
jgi:AGCS family alanine or glycine:cation symporter